MMTVSVAAPSDQVSQMASSENVCDRELEKYDLLRPITSSPGVMTKHHCCRGVRTLQVEQGQQLGDPLIQHPLDLQRCLPGETGDSLLEREGQQP